MKVLVKPATGVLAGLLLGLLSHQAAAMDEIVVSGAEAAARVQAGQALFRSQMQAQMQAYVRALTSSLKATLEKDLEQQPKPILRLAASELPDRG